MSRKSERTARAVAAAAEAALGDRPRPPAPDAARPTHAPGAAPPSAPDRAARIIDPALIDPDPDQPRKHFDPEELANLAASLAAEGQAHNITVYETRDPAGQPSGRYRLVAGERRWRAAKLRGLALSCRVLPAAPDDTARLVAQIGENDQRSDLNFQERGDAYRKLLERNGWSVAQLAGKVHRSEAHVRKALSVEEHSSPELKEAVSAGAVGTEAAYQASRIADPELRREVEEGLVEGTKTEEDARAAAEASPRSTRTGRPRKAFYSESVNLDGGYRVTVVRDGGTESPGHAALAAAAQAAAEIFRLRQGAAA